MDKIIIKNIDFAIAFRIGNTIYINKNIQRDSKLYNSLIKHELNHDSGNLTIKDIKNDLFGKSINKLEYYKFLLRNKSAWYQFSPVIRLEGKLIWDYQMLGIWIIGALMIYLGWFIGVRI